MTNSLDDVRGGKKKGIKKKIARCTREREREREERWHGCIVNVSTGRIRRNAGVAVPGSICHASAKSHKTLDNDIHVRRYPAGGGGKSKRVPCEDAPLSTPFNEIFRNRTILFSKSCNFIFSFWKRDFTYLLKRTIIYLSCRNRYLVCVILHFQNGLQIIEKRVFQ